MSKHLHFITKPPSSFQPALHPTTSNLSDGDITSAHNGVMCISWKLMHCRIDNIKGMDACIQVACKSNASCINVAKLS